MKTLSLHYAAGLLAALVLCFFCSPAGAQIAKSDMLSRIDHDNISFQRAPYINVPSQITEKLLERQHVQYPKFKDNMWYMAYVKESGFTNIIHYDWSADECFYIVLNDAAVKKKTKDVFNFVKSKGAETSDSAKRDKIPMKYCEKVYNFYSSKKD
jgi:hypothetical protein